jgi:predicted enzyme related to lactoylglutathione lyase
MSHFFQLTLRTRDVETARGFYTLVLGNQQLHIVQLHENAVARGARPHWLGYLRVDDVAGAAAAFSQRGAESFGKWVNPEGLEAAVMRDPGGAIVALAKPGPQSTEYGPEVSWYGLNTRDVEGAMTNYGELFGFQFCAPVQIAEQWTFHPFSFGAGEEPVGSMGDIAGRPDVHPHWLFQFRVAALEPAIAAARAGGGKVLDPITLPNGARVAICDDPDGAAFGLRERVR